MLKFDGVIGSSNIRVVSTSLDVSIELLLRHL